MIVVAVAAFVSTNSLNVFTVGQLDIGHPSVVGCHLGHVLSSSQLFNMQDVCKNRTYRSILFALRVKI